MRSVVAFIVCALMMSNGGVDYRIVVSYHAKLVKHKEWSIAIERHGEKIYLNIDNYNNRKLLARLDRDEYTKLLDFLNKMGIWFLKNHYSAPSPNAFYRIEVQQGKYQHEAIAEAGPLLSGDASRFREIIRKMENLAKTKLEK